MAFQTNVTEMVATDQTVTSKLGDTLAHALRTLPKGKQHMIPWTPDEGEQSIEVGKLDAKVNGYLSAFAAKDKYSDEQLIVIKNALDQARDAVAKKVGEYMNKDANKLRQGIAEINKSLVGRRVYLNAPTTERKFYFRVEEVKDAMSAADEIMAKVASGKK